MLSSSVLWSSERRAVLYSTLFPGAGQVYSDRDLTGIILGAATLGGIITSFVLNSKYKDEKGTFIENKDAYENNIELSKMSTQYNDLKDSHSKMKRTNDLSKVIISLTSILFIYNILDSYLFFPDQTGQSIKVTNNQQQNGFSINIHF